MDDILEYILFVIDLFFSWRVYAAFIPTILLALLFYFGVGWNSMATAITLGMAIVSFFVGVVWEYTND